MAARVAWGRPPGPGAAVKTANRLAAACCDGPYFPIMYISDGCLRHYPATKKIVRLRPGKIERAWNILDILAGPNGSPLLHCGVVRPRLDGSAKHKTTFGRK